MLHHFQSPAATTTTDGHQRPPARTLLSFDSDLEFDSTCSTPYVSAPSSPGRSPPPPPQPGFFYFSAPASPVHFILSTTESFASTNNSELLSPASSFEFDFSTPLVSANGTSPPGSVTMSSADELFLNGQIRPMKLSTHLERPQVLSPLLDFDIDSDDPFNKNDQNERGRSYLSNYRDKSVRRRTRSMSPLRTFWDSDFEAKIERNEEEVKKIKGKELEEADSGEMRTETHSNSVSSSRHSSAGRSSRRWVFLKEFLHRSKSEGRNNGHKFWGSLSFSPGKDKLKMEKSPAPKITTKSPAAESKENILSSAGPAILPETARKEVKRRVNNNNNNNGKRANPSAHVLHYTAKRAEAEEMRKRTFLPYRQGLLGCLAFSSRNYGAMNGFAGALNPVSST